MVFVGRFAMFFAPSRACDGKLGLAVSAKEHTFAEYVEDYGHNVRWHRSGLHPALGAMGGACIYHNYGYNRSSALCDGLRDW